MCIFRSKSSVQLAVATILAIGAAACESHCVEAGESTPNETIETRVKQLLRDLDADSRATRSQAENELLELGPVALEFLPPPADLSVPATRDAVRRIRLVLERRKATASVVVSRASLQGTQSISQAMESLSKQTGNGVDLSAVPELKRLQPVSIELREEPFWKGIDALVAAANLEFDSIRSGRLRLRAFENVGAHTLIRGELAAETSGAFRVSLGSARRRPAVGDNIPERVRFEMSLLAEPRLRPLFLHYAVADFRASTLDGFTFAATSPTAKIELPFGERGCVAQIDFDVPGDQPPIHATLRGKFSALTAAGPERFEFSNLSDAKGTSRRRGGVTVTLHAVEWQPQPNASDVLLRLLVAYDARGPAFESHRSWFFQNEAWMETADRLRVDLREPAEVSRQGDGTLTIDFRFEALPKDVSGCRFVYVVPTLLVDVPVAFEFRNIPVSNVDLQP